MPQFGKKLFPYTEEGYKAHAKAVAGTLKKGGKVGKKKKVVSRKKKRK